LLKQGADILDIGGESTRPGAQQVSLQEELQRVLPVVKEAVRLNVPISVDTYKPQVMQAVLEAGADIIQRYLGFAAKRRIRGGLLCTQVVAYV